MCKSRGCSCACASRLPPTRSSLSTPRRRSVDFFLKEREREREREREQRQGPKKSHPMRSIKERVCARVITNPQWLILPLSSFPYFKGLRGSHVLQRECVWQVQPCACDGAATAVVEETNCIVTVSSMNLLSSLCLISIVFKCFSFKYVIKQSMFEHVRQK